MARTVELPIRAKARKRENCVEEDWISQLPDEILITILSLLSFVEAARTRVLSKRWKYLWTHVKALNFEFPKKLMAFKNKPELAVGEIPIYVGWVNRVLQLHQGPDITDFKVNFCLSHKNSCDIDEWFNFAISKSVQKLEVNLLGHTVGCLSPSNRYTLPDNVYSLIKSPRGLSCTKSLAQLSLTCVNVTGELVEHFLSNCPLLERLCVSFSTLLVDLKVTGPSLCLKFLEISCCPYLQSVDIYAPNLASFIFPKMGGSTRVVVRHTPSLVDLSVGYCDGFPHTLPAFSSYFSQLESLTLHIILFWEVYEPQNFPVLTNVKNLTLLASARERDSFLYWTDLMEKFPSLHTFKLQLMSVERIRTRIVPRRTKNCLQTPHKCLKVVEFVGNIDFELAMYFVQNAVTLEKIIVDCRPGSLPAWAQEEFRENKRSMALRRHALDLKNELPLGVQLVMRPPQI